MIKFWAWVYRLTGWYSPWAELAEYRALSKRWDDIEERYVRLGDIKLEDAVGLEIGMWQAHYGFYRKFKY